MALDIADSLSVNARQSILKYFSSMIWLNSRIVYAIKWNAIVMSGWFKFLSSNSYLHYFSLAAS